MKPMGRDAKQQERTAAEPEKRPFVAPKLIRHGSLTDITRAGGSLISGASFF